LADQEWEVRAGQVYLLREGQLTARTYWLLVARNVATGEVTYCVSNAPPDTPLEKLLRVAFGRWNVETAHPNSTSSARWCGNCAVSYNPCIGVA
jgi:hypothetical protein